MATVNPINAFNRILLLILGLIALVAGVIALLLVIQVIHPADVSPGGFLLDFWQWIANLSGGAATTAVIVSILVALAGLALIVVELAAWATRSADVCGAQGWTGNGDGGAQECAAGCAV